MHFSCSGEAHRNELGRLNKDLGSLLLRNTLDGLQLSLRPARSISHNPYSSTKIALSHLRIGNRLYGVESAINKELNVSCCQPVYALFGLISIVSLFRSTMDASCTSRLESGIGAPGPPMLPSS